jgi:hypothetical protein
MPAAREPADLSGKRHWMRLSGTVHARVSTTALAEPIVKMADRPILRRIFDQVVPVVLLAVAAAGFVYAISIATTLRELRALEPITHPNLELGRCAPVAATAPAHTAEGDSRPASGATQQPGGERSVPCPPAPRQARPQ